MTKTHYIILLCFIIILNSVYSQHVHNPTKISEAITIDGILDDPAWAESESVSDFISFRPVSGEPAKYDTEVKVVYNDHSIYFGAYMEDVSRDSIMTQLTERDDLGNTDFFLVILDTYQSGNDALEFIVASTGVQLDAKVTSEGEDNNWDAVWNSAVHLTDQGWYAEIEIPYSAIRFTKKNVQEWNVNFMRRRSVTGEQSTWKFLDLDRNNPFLTQMGSLVNLKEIKPPLRLSFSPYASTYALHSKDANRVPQTSTGFSYNGGMDVKWGMNEAFTLDMTLVPDFGQVQSDDQVLNLSPFEVRFDENRPFFTEGAEFFEKAGIFYSRRIGGTPLKYGSAYQGLSDDESVIENPLTAQLYNATKITGRSANGLGVGFFNAVAASTFATIKNETTCETRTIKTSPLANYNVSILDQNLKNNSSISLTNTNVWRQGDGFYDANVTAATVNLKDKNQKWGVSAKGVLSVQSFHEVDNNTGHAFSMDLQRLDGSVVYGISYDEKSDDYNPNDLGFLNNANERSLRLWAQYRNFDGLWKFNQFQSWINISHERLYAPNRFSNNHVNLGFWGQLANLWNVNMWANYRPDAYNHFEPRTAGRFHKNPDYMNLGFWVGTDNRKKLRLSMSAFGYRLDENGRNGFNVDISPRYRISDKLTVSAGVELDKDNNSYGWTDFGDHEEIFYAQRNTTTISNIMGINYTPNQKINLNVRVRHYWAKVVNQDFYELNQEGGFSPTDFNADKDLTFNSFTVDAVLRWRFAPGSDLFFVWKNNIVGVHQDASDDFQSLDYFSGINHLKQFPQNNSLSLRCVYFLDYERMTRRKL